MIIKSKYEALSPKLFKYCDPTPVKNPKIIWYDKDLAHRLNLNEDENWNALGYLSGNQIHNTVKPIALAYSGHQFGHFTQLGDGRALLLGESVDVDGLSWEIQLKGSGPTPFSRRGDGRATLRSLVKELIFTVCLNGLNIPATKTLALIQTDDQIFREDIFQGAILTRIAASHIRFGSFQYAATLMDKDIIKQLADVSILRHYPECLNSKTPYMDFFKHVLLAQSSLIAKWMSVGFIHGVMNTDNMTVSGETIDFGPCAFMDEYIPSKVYSSIDSQGRYAYSSQPMICQWNLARFAESLLPIFEIDENEKIEWANNQINQFSLIFKKDYNHEFLKKIGISEIKASDDEFIKNLLNILEINRWDLTHFFSDLKLNVNEMNNFYQIESFINWHSAWRKRTSQINPKEMTNLMERANPNLIARNYHIENVIKKIENGDSEPLNSYLNLLKAPFDEKLKISAFYQNPGGFSENYVTYCGT